MKFISTASPSARYYVDPAANSKSVRFHAGELETDDPFVIDALLALIERGCAIEAIEVVEAAPKPKRKPAASKAKPEPSPEPEVAAEPEVAPEAAADAPAPDAPADE